MYKENERIHRKPEFLKYLPSNWETSKIKNDALLRMGETILKNDLVESGIPVYSASREDRPFGYLKNPSLMLNKGDIVIGARGTLGFPKVMEGPSTCTQTTICISPKNKMNSYFTKYCLEGLMSELIIEEGSGVPQLTVETVKNFELPNPDDNTKEKIVRYLDSKCSTIDSAISKITKEIEKLEEYKKSVITEAVTKGLDPDAEMKNSGKEWIGTINKSFTTKRMKYLASYRNGLTYKPENVCDESNGMLVLRSSNIQKGKLSFEDNVYVDCKIPEKLLVEEGDILMCVRNGSAKLVGKTAIIKKVESMTFGAFMMVLKPRCNTSYLNYILSSSVMDGYRGLFSTSTVNQITSSVLDNMYVPYCENEDIQKEIADYLDRKCKTIDKIIKLKQEQIDSLGYCKKSLIYECVTGKKEIPV